MGKIEYERGQRRGFAQVTVADVADGISRAFNALLLIKFAGVFTLACAAYNLVRMRNLAPAITTV